MTEDHTTSRVKVSNTKSHVWPAVRLGLAAEITALAAELADTQWLSPEQIEERQMLQLAHLLQFAVKHSPYYAARFAAAGVSLADFPSIEAFRQLPLQRRQDIQSAGDHFFCGNVPADQGNIAEAQTSGSTGEPVRVKKTGISQLFMDAYTLRSHDWHRLPFTARYSVIRASAKSYGEHPNWGAPHTLLHGTGPAQIIPITTPLDKQMGLLRRFQPETLLIYPSNLRGLVDRWRVRGFDLPALRSIRTIGETLTDDLKRDITELSTQLSIIDSYSSEECGAIAMQCPGGSGYHVMSETLIVEILDHKDEPCAPGEVGRIVVTDLQNLASPLIRYDLGDYGRVGATCSCSRGLTKLEQILGRQRNLVVKPNGERHWPLVGFRHFASIAPIRQYQMIQESLQRVTVRFVTDEPLNDDQKARLTQLIQDKLGYEFEIEMLDQRNDLPHQPNGKFEEFISRVP